MNDSSFGHEHAWGRRRQRRPFLPPVSAPTCFRPADRCFCSSDEFDIALLFSWLGLSFGSLVLVLKSLVFGLHRGF